jgi:hypothetical protein
VTSISAVKNAAMVSETMTIVCGWFFVDNCLVYIVVVYSLFFLHILCC